MSSMTRTLAHVAVAAFVLAIAVSCGGGDDDDGAGAGSDTENSIGVEGGGGPDVSASTGDAAPGADAESGGSPDSSAPAVAEVGGESYSFASVSCSIGDGFYGADFRRVTASVTETDYPGLSVAYAPGADEPLDEDGPEPNQVSFFEDADTLFQTADPSAIDATPTADGITGTAVLDTIGEISFTVTCPEETTIFNTPEEPVEESGDDGDGDAAAPAPDVATGTVTIDGVTDELSGPTRNDVMFEGGDTEGRFDFDICETVNPAFEGAFNVSGTLDDGTDYRASGTIGELGELDGFELGDFPDEELVPFDEVALDGRTLSGSATTSRGPVEFTFTC